MPSTHQGQPKHQPPPVSSRHRGDVPVYTAVGCQPSVRGSEIQPIFVPIFAGIYINSTTLADDERSQEGLTTAVEEEKGQRRVIYKGDSNSPMAVPNSVCKRSLRATSRVVAARRRGGSGEKRRQRQISWCRKDTVRTRSRAPTLTHQGQPEPSLLHPTPQPTSIHPRIDARSTRPSKSPSKVDLTSGGQKIGRFSSPFWPEAL